MFRVLIVGWDPAWTAMALPELCETTDVGCSLSRRNIAAPDSPLNSLMSCSMGLFPTKRTFPAYTFPWFSHHISLIGTIFLITSPTRMFNVQKGTYKRPYHGNPLLPMWCLVMATPTTNKIPDTHKKKPPNKADLIMFGCICIVVLYIMLSHNLEKCQPCN